MNERIKELWDEAAKLEPDPSWQGQTRFMEKFAELIVEECIEQCSKALVVYTGQPSVTHNYAVGLCQDNIKEHFGVES
jgi:hypothetical protein